MRKTIFTILFLISFLTIGNAQSNGQKAQAQIKYVTALPATCKPNQALIYAVIGALPMHYHVCTDTNTFADITAAGAGTVAGSDKQIQFNDGGSFGANAGFIFDKTNVFLGIGTLTPLSAIHVADTSVATPRGILNSQHSNSTNSAQFNCYKSRGTNAVPTTIVTGDVLCNIIAGGYDGSNYLSMGSIRITSTGTIAATRVPTILELRTATDATPSVLTTALTIGADQSAAFVGPITTTNVITQTSNSASAFTSGPSGTTNPVVQIDNSAGGSNNGFKFTGSNGNSNVITTAQGGGTNIGFTFTPKGTGNFAIQNSSLVHTPSVTSGTGSSAGYSLIGNNLTTGNLAELSSSSQTTGSILSIASTSTAGATGAKGLNIAISGANAASGQTINGGTISVTNTNATSGTNTALTLMASGATTANQAIFVSTATADSVLGNNIYLGSVTNGIRFNAAAVGTVDFYGNGTTLSARLGTTQLAIGSSLGLSNNIPSSPGVFLRYSAAANLAHGIDAASPVGQTDSVGNVTGGTSDTSGANRNIDGSQSTGTGNGGSILLRTSPAAGSTASTQNALVTALTIDSKAHVIHGGTAPTIGGSCGTSPSIVGTDQAGKVTAGTVAPTSCTVTFNKTWTNAPACIAVNETTSNLLRATTTTTTLTLAGTMVASDVLAFVCAGY